MLRTEQASETKRRNGFDLVGVGCSYELPVKYQIIL